MSPLVLAHAGHWATSLAFFGPVLVLPLALWIMTAMTRHEDDLVAPEVDPDHSRDG